MPTSLLELAFQNICEGYSTDRVIAEPRLYENFVRECHSLGLEGKPEELGRRLINFRKAGKLGSTKAKRTSFNDDEYRHAVEIAVRHIERRDNVSLDDILLCPEIASEFDAICCDISPGFSSLRYRWAALRLRKSRNLQPEILGHVVPTEVILIPVTNIALEEIPKAPGIYCFSSLKATLYVDEASCLRTRIKKHVVHSDNKYLARWIWEQGVEELTLELHVLKSSVATKVRKAMETELIRSRKPEFNVLGKLK